MDAIELLTRDHRAVEKLFSQFDGGDDDTRRTAAESIIRELSIHAAIEEEFFYPMVKKEVPAAAAMIDHGIEEHQEAKQVLAKLDELIDKTHTKAYAEKLRRLQRLIGDHVEEEEKELFPKVREALTKTRLNEVGTVMNKAKAAAPTRPHPNVPANPAVQATVGKASAVVDRMRDAVTGRERR